MESNESKKSHFDIFTLTDKLKSYGLIISIPTLILISSYFIGEQADLHEKEKRLLTAEISLLKSANAQNTAGLRSKIEDLKRISYTDAFSVIDAQRKVYELQIKQLDQQISAITTKLSEARTETRKEKEKFENVMRLADQLGQKLAEKKDLIAKVTNLLVKGMSLLAKNKQLLAEERQLIEKGMRLLDNNSQFYEQGLRLLNKFKGGE